jgi:hypothetical protein
VILQTPKTRKHQVKRKRHKKTGRADTRKPARTEAGGGRQAPGNPAHTKSKEQRQQEMTKKDMGNVGRKA